MKLLLIFLLTAAVPLAVNLLFSTIAFAKQAATQDSFVSAEALRPLLNSERIKLKFGSYAIEVLQASKRLRISNLYSTQGEHKTTRTLALVSYPENIPPALAEQHSEIVSGQSLGAVFKRNGWKITKEHLYFGSLSASDSFAGLYRRMGDIGASDLAVHIYQFKVSKNGEQYNYAAIAEIHHPDYLAEKDLKAIYPKAFLTKGTADAAEEAILQKLRYELSLLSL